MEIKLSARPAVYVRNVKLFSSLDNPNLQYVYTLDVLCLNQNGSSWVKAMNACLFHKLLAKLVQSGWTIVL